MVNQKPLVAAGMVLSLALSSSLWAQGRESVGVTLAARGDVSATDLVSLENRMLRRRSELFNVDRVVTGADSRAQLRMEDDALISLRPGSELVIAEYEFDPETGEGKAIMELVSGGLRTLSGNISPANGNAEYELRTTAGSIGIRGTHYEIVDTDRGVFMGVWDGDIEVQPGQGQSFSLGRSGDYAFASVGDDGQVEFYLDPPEVFSDDGTAATDTDDSSEPQDAEETEDTASDDDSTPGAETSGDTSADRVEETDSGSDLAGLPVGADGSPGMDEIQTLLAGAPGLGEGRGPGAQNDTPTHKGNRGDGDEPVIDPERPDNPKGSGGDGDEPAEEEDPVIDPERPDNSKGSGGDGDEPAEEEDPVIDPERPDNPKGSGGDGDEPADEPGPWVIPPDSVRTPPVATSEIVAIYELESIRVQGESGKTYEAGMSFRVNFSNGTIDQGRLSIDGADEKWMGRFSGGYTGARIDIGGGANENRMNYATFNESPAIGYLPNSYFYYDKGTDAFGEFRFEARHGEQSIGGEWHAARHPSAVGAE